MRSPGCRGRRQHAETAHEVPTADLGSPRMNELRNARLANIEPAMKEGGRTRAGEHSCQDVLQAKISLGDEEKGRA